MFEENSLYRNREAAAGLGVGDATLRNSRCSGKLSGVTTPEYIRRGRIILYSGKTLNLWIGQFSKSSAIDLEA